MPTLFLAEMTGDLLWYSLGGLLRSTRFGLWIENHVPGHANATTKFQKKGETWLLLSRFIIGFSPLVVFSIGWSGMAFRTFYKNSLLSILMWIPVFMGLSYGIVSGLAPLAATDFKEIGWIAAGGFLLFLILDYAIAKGVKMFAGAFLGINNKNEDLTNEGGETYN
jgi:membrane protein DedA with SNARE-associated domain